MKANEKVSRRRFIASTSSMVLLSQAGGLNLHAEEPATEKLAIDGGAKAVTSPMPKAARWGAPELEQLSQALKQDSLYYWRNKQTALLTQRYQKIYGHKYVQPCSSGTAALHIAAGAAGVGPGDEVITSGITDIGTVIGVLYQQGVPVFADLEPNTGCLDPADVEKKITPRTKAIIAVHLFGNPCKLAELKEIADKHKVLLIEDSAQAWGARYKGKPISTTGQIACFSLQDTKHITCGDGGIVVSNDERLGKLLTKFGDKGTNRYLPADTATALAPNYRMSELQAAFVAAQLLRLENIAGRRSALGALLTEELQDVSGVSTHHVDEGNRCTYWYYMLRVQPSKLKCDRAQFVKALAAEGAALKAGYIATPVYGLPMFQNHSFFAGKWPVKEMKRTNMDYTKVKNPVTDDILKTCVLFHLTEAMDEAYVKQIAAAIRKVAKFYSA